MNRLLPSFCNALCTINHNPASRWRYRVNNSLFSDIADEVICSFAGCVLTGFAEGLFDVVKDMAPSGRGSTSSRDIDPGDSFRGEGKYRTMQFTPIKNIKDQANMPMKLTPIKRKRLSEVAIEQIRESILSNKIKPGDKLPSENEMVAQLGVSRVSVREAIRMLEISGIVEVRHGRGVFVKELTGDMFVPLGQWVSQKKQTLQQHFETRLILEPEISALAANYASASDIGLLHQNIYSQKEVKEDDLVATIRFDIEFHCLIAQATRNKDVAMVMNTIAKYSFEGWKAALRTKGRSTDAVEEHLRIVDALFRKDPDRARKAMRDHLEESVKRLEKQGYEKRQRAGDAGDK